MVAQLPPERSVEPSARDYDSTESGIREPSDRRGVTAAADLIDHFLIADDAKAELRQVPRDGKVAKMTFDLSLSLDVHEVLPASLCSTDYRTRDVEVRP